MVLFACEEPVDLSSIESESGKILVECELTPGHKAEAKLYTIGDFTQLENINYEENATLKLVSSEDELFFKYDKSRKIYVSEHIVNPSYTYVLIGYLENRQKEIKSNLISLPSAQKLAFSSSPKLKKVINEKGLDQVNISFSAKIPSKVNLEKYYYRIKLERKIFKQVVIQGVPETIYSGKTEVLNFLGNDEIPLAFTKSDSDGSILFDASRFGNENINFNFATKSFLAGDKMENIHYTLETITESTYRYLVSKIKQNNASNSGASDPVINYTNIQNGYGYLGASSPVLDSIVIK